MTDAWSYTDPERSAQASALTSFEDNPDEAARAYQLSKATGIPAEAVHGNLAEAENQYKGALVGHLLKNNPYLQDYVNSHPLAGAISNDDYGQLDRISQKLQEAVPVFGSFAALGLPAIAKIAPETVETFKQGLAGLVEAPGKILNLVEPEDKQGLSAMTQQKALELGATPEQAQQIARTELARYQRGEGLTGALFAVPTMLGSPAIAAFREFISKPLEKQTGFPADVTEGLTVATLAALGLRHSGNIQTDLAKAKDVVDKAEPYLKGNQPVPVGLDPAIDKMHTEQAKADLAMLDEVQKEVQKSTTLERAPELAKAFVQQHVGEAKIGISADAVAELYKDKMPQPEDGLLGWVPDLEKQMNAALATGGDVEIPLADWLTKVEPEIAKELHDHLRLRKGGLTLDESKVLSQQLMVEAYHGSPHEFDAFSMEKIGTGEGAQSYGHGLYFAENRGVAKSYTESVSSTNEEAVASMYLNRAGSREEAVANLKTRVANMQADPSQAGNSARLGYDKALQMLESGWEPSKGNEYRVRIHADKEHFLDWDSPLPEDSPIADKINAAVAPNMPAIPGQTGEQVYRTLTHMGYRPEQASALLAKAGIPGIKYLDQGSRKPRESDLKYQESRIAEMQEELKTADPDRKAQLEHDIARFQKAHEDLKAEIANQTHNFVLFDDSLIEITHKNDQAVASVRKAAELEPKLDQLVQAEEHEGRIGEWVPIGKAVEGFVPEKFTEYEEAVSRIVEEELAKIVPQKVDVQFTSNIRKTGTAKEAGGVYSQYTSQAPTITLALAADLDIPGIARHEAIHHLRGYGFFTDAEWDALASAAKEEKWAYKERKGKNSSVYDKYFGEGPQVVLEEAIADEFRYWNRNPKSETLVDKVFEKLRNFLASIKAKWDELASKNPEVNKIFQMIESGEIGRREGTEPRHSKAFNQFSEKEPELPGVTRQEDLSTFKPSAVGLTGLQMKKVMDLIAKLNEEDQAYQQAKIEKLERVKQTKEWKNEEGLVRDEVENDLASRPDISAAEFFRSGKLYGEETGSRPRIDPKQLTPEQRKLFPEKYQRRDGMAPEDVAQLFGYPTVDAMVEGLAKLEGDMATAGETRLAEFTRKLAIAETERRMLQRFGDLEENILREAQEHVVSPTQMDLLHEETVALGMQNGWEMPFTKQDVKAGTAEAFGEMPASAVSMEKFLKDSGKAGKLAQLALLEGNATEFFKQRQRQEFALHYAEQAKRFAKEQERFQRVIDRMAKREVPTVEQAYTNYVQELLTKAGVPVRNSPLEIARSIEFQGYRSLDNFVDRMNANGWDIQVPENFQPKKLKEMSVAEWQEFRDAIDSLVHVGRDEKKINIAGEKEDRDAFRARVVDNIKQLPKRDIQAMEQGGRWLYKLDASWTRMEEIVKDLDLRKELGPLYEALIQPFELSKAKKFEMTETLAKRLKEIGGFDKEWKKTLADEIPQDFIFDSHNQTYFQLTRWNMVKMMLNMGNEGNFSKLARGIASAEVGQIASPHRTLAARARIEQLVRQHATKADWDFVQNIWDIFKGWEKDADTVVRNTSGKVPKWVEPTPVDTPHGQYRGGYFPLVPDRLRPVGQGLREQVTDADALMGPNYYRATTSRPHHLDRTGATYFVDITNGIENIAGRMQQHIHDIAFRDFVVNAGKVIYDNKIRQEIRAHYGTEYDAQLEPWLKRIANELTVPERELQGWNDALRFFRLNLIAAALPLNYSVMLSPSVGTANLRSFLSFNSDRGGNKALVMEKSAELKHVLYNLDRDITEQLTQAVGKSGWSSFQRSAIEKMYKPLVWTEQQFRMNTFYGEYMKQKADGRTDAQAASLADSLVRERHGAVSLGDLPSLLASKSEFVKIATVFMGWFSMIRNWNRQLPEQYRQSDYSGMAKNIWGTVLVSAIFNATLFTHKKEKEGLFHYFGRALLDTPMSMVPYIREAWSYASDNRRPTSPIFGFMLSAARLLKDGVNLTQGKKIEKPVRHVADVLGQGFGVPAMVQLGRTGEFLYDVQHNKQRPRDAIEWMRGLSTGESKLRK